MQSKTISIAVATLVIGIAVGYFIPHAASAKTASTFAGRASGATRFGPGSFTRGGSVAGGNGMLAGSIVSVSGEDVTLKTPDGSSHIVLITPDTTVSKSVTGSVSDLTSGSDVLVSGTSNSDGSISASIIQLRPAGAPGRFGAPASSTPGTAR